MMPATALEWCLALIGLVIGAIYAFDGWSSTSAAKSLKDSPRLVNFKYAISVFFIALIADFAKLGVTVDKARLLQIYLGWFVVTAIVVIIVVAAVMGYQFRQLERECRGIQFLGVHPVLHFLMYGYRSADEKLKEAKENWSDTMASFVRQFLPHYNTQLTQSILAVSYALKAASPEVCRAVAGTILQNIEAVVKTYNEKVPNLNIAVNYMRAQPSATATEAMRDATSFAHGQWEEYEFVLILEQYAGNPKPPLFILPVWKKAGGKEHVLPGAPQAFLNNGDVLVSDTKKVEFPSRLPAEVARAINDYFVEKSFNSFLAMPIISNGTACGVLNIEANYAAVFGNDKKAQEEIIKMLKPFCHLLGFLIEA